MCERTKAQVARGVPRARRRVEPNTSSDPERGRSLDLAPPVARRWIFIFRGAVRREEEGDEGRSATARVLPRAPGARNSGKNIGTAF